MCDINIPLNTTTTTTNNNCALQLRIPVLLYSKTMYIAQIIIHECAQSELNVKAVFLIIVIKIIVNKRSPLHYHSSSQTLSWLTSPQGTSYSGMCFAVPWNALEDSCSSHSHPLQSRPRTRADSLRRWNTHSCSCCKPILKTLNGTILARDLNRVDCLVMLTADSPCDNRWQYWSVLFEHHLSHARHCLKGWYSCLP